MGSKPSLWVPGPALWSPLLTQGQCSPLSNPQSMVRHILEEVDSSKTKVKAPVPCNSNITIDARPIIYMKWWLQLLKIRGSNWEHQLKSYITLYICYTFFVPSPFESNRQSIWEKYPLYKVAYVPQDTNPFTCTPCHLIPYSLSLHHIRERSLQVCGELSHDAPLCLSPPGVSFRNHLSTSLTARLPYVTHLFGSGILKENMWSGR